MRMSPPLKLVMLLLTFYLIIISKSFFDYLILLVPIIFMAYYYKVDPKDIIHAIKFETWIVFVILILNTNKFQAVILIMQKQ